MRINGKNRLACKTLIKDVNPDKPITVEPIKGLPVEKDLIVDMEPFFDAYREVMPFLITTGNEPTRERIQSQADRDRFDDTTKCILCAACTTSCPVFWNDGQYFGPAAIVNAHRFIFDTRDEGGAQRLEILNDKEGRVALPHHLQLHRRLPAWHPGDPGDPGSEARAPDLAVLTLVIASSGSSRTPEGALAPLASSFYGAARPFRRPLRTLWHSASRSLHGARASSAL